MQEWRAVRAVREVRALREVRDKQGIGGTREGGGGCSVLYLGLDQSHFPPSIQPNQQFFQEA